MKNEPANLPKGRDAKLEGLMVQTDGSQLPKFIVCKLRQVRKHSVVFVFQMKKQGEEVMKKGHFHWRNYFPSWALSGYLSLSENSGILYQCRH